jgi:uncharacterized protein (TIGR02271 family)
MSDKIVAFYGTKDQAERVRDELIDANFDRDDVRVFTPEGPGFWRELKEAFGFADEEDRYLYEEAARRGAIAVLVDLDDADAPGAQTAIQILQRHSPLDLDVQAQQWRKEGWQGYTAQGRPTQGMATAANVQTTGQQQRPAAAAQRVEQGEQVLPVVEEQVKIGKRAVQRSGGLRVYSKVTERPVEEQVQLRQERATVERRPVDRPLGDTDRGRAFQERTIEVTERSEEPVVSKQARVVEEVVVGKQVEQRTQTVRETARRTDVEVEKLNPDNERTAETFAGELCRDQRFQNRNWDEVEPQARATFEQRYPGSRWEQFKDSIRRGYEKMRANV